MVLAGSAQGGGARALLSRAAEAATLEALFDAISGVVFFIKDRECRYRLVNETLVRRTGARDKRALLGRRADEVFPAALGASFRRQDERVMATGRPLVDRLELHLYPSHGIGWCRTFKTPLSDGGEVVGLIGFSQDLGAPAEQGAPAGVARAVGHLEARLDQPLRVRDLAAVANMAPRTFERTVHRIFGMSAGELRDKG
ncbi:MAG TPA: PAS domain-containing protein [Candidatus Limnocylindria bacterium]|nr:PAS domain-containing protein [Candidatus Limnocylindria bacterium]